jgi:hypothetical protein
MAHLGAFLQNTSDYCRTEFAPASSLRPSIVAFQVLLQALRANLQKHAIVEQPFSLFVLVSPPLSRSAIS